jgi:hypothetical protein
MQALGRDGVAKLFFKEFCTGHPELLKPAWDNINLIKRYTLGFSRWTHMTEYRKVFTRDKFTDIFRFIKFLQEKCGDQNDTFGVVKKLNRQDIMKKRKSVKSYMVDEVQSFDETESGEGGEGGKAKSAPPSDKSRNKGDKSSSKPSGVADKTKKKGAEVLPIDDFD